EVLDVARAAEVVVLDHREHVPAELLAHVPDRAERHVGVRVDTRLIRPLFDERPELGGQRTHHRKDAKGTKDTKVTGACPAPPVAPSCPSSPSWPSSPSPVSPDPPPAPRACAPAPCAAGGCWR